MVSSGLHKHVQPGPDTDEDSAEDDGASGVCRPTNGVQTDKRKTVKILADLTNCGEAVKELATLVDSTDPLQTCAQKADEDDECGFYFQLEDETFVCSCVTGTAKCPKVQ